MWVFLTFIINLFALSQIVTLFNSSFSISANFVYSLPSRKTLVSSAKKMVKNNLDALEKSFIKRINRSGPKIVPVVHRILWIVYLNYIHHIQHTVFWMINNFVVDNIDYHVFHFYKVCPEEYLLRYCRRLFICLGIHQQRLSQYLMF